jgi:CarD family transcriptional regulator, regulator of rRNA transcription
VELAVGDEVVYATHGIGRVVERTSSVAPSGEEREVVVLELVDGLTVTLPLDRAREQLRPLLSSSDVNRVRRALREERVLGDEPWLSRRGALASKLATGDPILLAEIVGDGSQRDRTLRESGKRSQLSPGERELVAKARQLLADEIRQARGTSREDADAWIDAQLAHGRE